MPPKRRRTESSTERVEKHSNEVAAKRVTRSSTRLGDSAPQVLVPVVVAPKTKKSGKTKTTPQVPKTTPPSNNSPSEVHVDDDDVSTVIILEHCKQCNRIKRRALEAKEGLEEAAHGVKVLINPEKPRRGCFEIRTAGGEILFSIQGLKRPFQPLMNVNMPEVVSDIVAKLNIPK